MFVFILIAKLFYFYLPTGLANMSPVLFKDTLHFLAKPVDGGATFAKQPLFGAHKTWRGLIVGTIMGGLLFIVQYGAAVIYPQTVSWTPFDITEVPVWFGFVFAAGALLGDLIKSFFKRRIAVAPGKTWFPFDQIDFLVGSTVVAMLFFDITLLMWVLIISIGIFFHILVNHIGYWLKIKDSPW